MARSPYQQHVSGVMRLRNPRSMAEARAAMRHAAALWRARARAHRSERRPNPDRPVAHVAIAVALGLALLSALGRAADRQRTDGAIL